MVFGNNDDARDVDFDSGSFNDIDEDFDKAIAGDDDNVDASVNVIM